MSENNFQDPVLSVYCVYGTRVIGLGSKCLYLMSHIQLYGEYSASIFYCKSAPYNPFALNRLQSAQKIETRIYEIPQHPTFDSLSWFPLSLKSRTYNCDLNLIHIRYAKSYFMLILLFVS